MFLSGTRIRGRVHGGPVADPFDGYRCLANVVSVAATQLFEVGGVR